MGRYIDRDKLIDLLRDEYKKALADKNFIGAESILRIRELIKETYCDD